MGEPYLYEFLYRGRPAGSAEAPAWHVVIGQHVTPPGAAEAQFVASGALTPAQAEAAGFPLSAVLAGIDAAALAGRDAAAAEAAALRRERDALVVERDGLAGQLAAREAPAAELPAISDRQFFQALAQAGAITADEALAAVMTGRLPAAIEAAVSALPEAERFAARMLLSGATAFERGHPMVARLGAAIGYDAAALDALWQAAAAL
ncbi:MULTISPECIES: hypothetical protein [Methylobacterium]|jgi:hypothetical protein|uniref:hypothetical protein n=1 Tax=Methylobacterium TaxID=407 RepID=UPI0008DFA50D|nr:MULTISPECIES: hypothetical protein [Methylobacterium]MBK3400774.1 hypothetical protein [Methylobacterium ajmalii]MBZ6417135.1 hypothetical protein [Methylobacterium sp.]SFF90297.1 hypothetical protein SAMN04487844_1782 [Methylobacterium sp. yr596]